MLQNTKSLGVALPLLHNKNSQLLPPSNCGDNLQRSYLRAPWELEAHLWICCGSAEVLFSVERVSDEIKKLKNEIRELESKMNFYKNKSENNEGSSEDCEKKINEYKEILMA